ncbi:hypothetical protein AAER89_29550, partial [Klebsiella pneumoniae]|uniref:hypothetical protein n=1 Tax=Klebsiella pneumoniae TaxID=573 RepID=UPI003135E874
IALFTWQKAHEFLVALHISHRGNRLNKTLEPAVSAGENASGRAQRGGRDMDIGAARWVGHVDVLHQDEVHSRAAFGAQAEGDV